MVRDITSLNVGAWAEAVITAIHAVVAPIAAYMLWRKSWRSWSNILLFIMTSFSFGLSSLYWAWEIAAQAVRIDIFFIHPEKRGHANLTTYSPVLDAISRANYFFSDAVVLWRAWVLCREDYKRALWIPFLCLTCAILAGTTTLATRVALSVTVPTSEAHRRLSEAINHSQEIALPLSLMTNVTATTIISHKAWRYRRLIQDTGKKSQKQSTRIQKILALLIESGFIYSIAGTILLIAVFIRFPWGTLGDYYGPVFVEIAYTSCQLNHFFKHYTGTAVACQTSRYYFASKKASVVLATDARSVMKSAVARFNQREDGGGMPPSMCSAVGLLSMPVIIPCNPVTANAAQYIALSRGTKEDSLFPSYSHKSRWRTLKLASRFALTPPLPMLGLHHLAARVATSGSMQTTSDDLSTDGSHALYATMSLVFESFFFGIYAMLVPFSVHILMKRGLRSLTNLFMFTAMFVPFVLSMLYWAVQIAEQAVHIQTFFVHRENRDTINITTFSSLFNGIILINYILGDAIVVWRSWVMSDRIWQTATYPYRTACGHNGISVAATVLATIGVKTATFVLFADGTDDSAPTVNAINVLQVTTLVISLLTNLTATGFISHKAWHYRITVKAGLMTRALTLMFVFIPLTFGTLGDIYLRVNAEIAGIYPTIVVALVGLERTLNDTTFWRSDTARSPSTILHAAQNAQAAGKHI
ncbi:hypothetical protein NM688_g2597 [Phlebia brevispora]|uniref:Uncharacterized protein n=1 Tax=Phlebia brevispora TaxID=194682 RepID=A0ACC1T8C0_9APHY|nr:hypothetical protein NM688_g2597 [Phlebia brevispora]